MRGTVRVFVSRCKREKNRNLGVKIASSRKILYLCSPKVEPLISKRKERNNENKERQHPIRTILFQAVTDIVANIERVRRF